MRAVAKRYRLSEASVRRHVKHIREVVAKAKAGRERRLRDVVINVYQEFARDILEMNEEIRKSKVPLDRQRWYLVKGRRLETVMRHVVLREALERGRGGEDGKPRERVLPASIQQIIDAVVHNDE